MFGGAFLAVLAKNVLDFCQFQKKELKQKKLEKLVINIDNHQIFGMNDNLLVYMIGHNQWFALICPYLLSISLKWV